MSLTSILSDTKNHELRDKLRTEFLRPAFKLKSELKAPPLTKNYGIVGTAFDYLMRFYLQYNNKDKIIQRSGWVADHAYRSLTKYLSSKEQLEIRTGFLHDRVFKIPHLIELIESQYKEAKDNYDKFISDGQLTDKIISSTIFLAKLDLYVRTKIVDSNFDNHDSADIKDIHSIISLVDKELFIAKKNCYLNPVFGEGSMVVGGADADLIIDNTLIDIKVTKHLKLEREYLNQVLGYYILSLIGGVNNNHLDKPIENIGIYFARHGELLTFPLSSFGDTQKFDTFKNWFVTYVTREQKLADDLYNFVNKNFKKEVDKPKTKRKSTVKKKKVADKIKSKSTKKKKSSP